MASIRRTRGGLVEILFGLPDMSRRRVVMPATLVTVDNVTFTAEALTVLTEIQRTRS